MNNCCGKEFLLENSFAQIFEQLCSFEGIFLVVSILSIFSVFVLKKKVIAQLIIIFKYFVNKLKLL